MALIARCGHDEGTGGRAVEKAEKAGVKLMSNANVYKLESDDKGRVTAALYYDRNKGSHRVTGKTFIVAANGIESPRLLLLSASDKFPKGLANAHDMVDRHLTDHPSTSLTFDADEDLWLSRGPQSPSSINTMRDGAFRKEHAPYQLDFTNISRVDGATTALIAAGVYGPEFERRLRYSAARELNVKTVLEVLPHPDNRITLSAQKDSMGIPKPEAHYRIDEYTHRGAIRALDDFRQIAERMGGTNLRFTRDGDYANNQHICGTLMMGNDPATSVVDKWGRAHDHENLYLVGTGVIPTAGTCNSTENGLALALHSVHHILGGQAVSTTAAKS